MELKLTLAEDDFSLLPYYARIVEIPAEQLVDLTPTEQVDLLADTLYKQLREQAVGLKAKEAGLQAREDVINEYKEQSDE